MPRAIQSKPLLFTLALVLAWLAVVAAVWSGLAGPPSEDTSQPVISNTAWVAVAAWCTASVLAMIGAAPVLARGFYAWGSAVFLLHVALAFHLAHGWSHAAAVEHVERSSGFGPGIFVSYLFTLTWLADAAWCVLAFESYRRRSTWWNWLVYGFMAFVIFNATVVYGEGMGRWLCGVFFAAMFAIGMRGRSSLS